MTDQSAARIEALKTLPTPNISDALDRLGIAGAMAGIGALAPNAPCMVGLARPLLQGPRHPGAEPGATYTRHVGWVEKSLQRGDVAVISCAGGPPASSWGHLLSLRSRNRGVAGTIVDGYVRDPAQIIEMGYPVFVRSLGCAAGTKLRLETLSIDEPVQCGGVQVRRGDFVVGDDSGVVVIPPERVDEIIAIAREVFDREQSLIASL